MTKRNALVVSRIGKQNEKSGIAKRVQDISIFLEELGFQVEFAADPRLGKNNFYDLICISSFTNAYQIILARKKTSFLWFDAMDSWRLTRRSLFFDSPVREAVKILREFFGRPLVHLPELITYCSLRDAQIDRSNSQKTLIFGPREVKNFKPQDFGDRFVFVGPSGYYPNRQAVEFLFELASLRYFSERKLHIYGESNHYNEVHEDVYIHGEAEDYEIYGNRDIHLAPIWSGAGIKYKSFSPLALGIRVISSKEGANGIKQNLNIRVCATKFEFEKAIHDLDWDVLESPESTEILEVDQRILIRKFILDAMTN